MREFLFGTPGKPLGDGFFIRRGYTVDNVGSWSCTPVAVLAAIEDGLSHKKTGRIHSDTARLSAHFWQRL